MVIPPKTTLVGDDGDTSHCNYRAPTVKLQHTDFKSHKTKVTITTPTSQTTPDQIIYPHPHSSFSSSDHSYSEPTESETGIQMSESDFTTNTTTTSTTILFLVKEGIEFYKNEQYANALKSFNTVLKSQMLCKAEIDNPLVAQTLANIGCVYLRQDRHQHAVESLEKSMEMMRRLRTNNVPEKNVHTPSNEFSLAGVLNNMGTAKSLQGDYEASLGYYWEALRDAIAQDGASNKKDVANAFFNIGRVSIFQKYYSVASSTLNESLRLEKELYGDRSIEIFDTLNLIGFVQFSTEALDEAVITFTEALSVATTKHGSVHEKVAVSLLNVGMVLEKEGDLNEALRCFSTAQQICERCGLNEDDCTMRAAIRSANEIRRELSLVQRARSSSPSYESENKNTETSAATTGPAESSLLFQSKLKSHLHKETPRVIINKYNPRSKFREDEMNTAYSTRFNDGNYKLERFITEYREDPFWELDDSSMVEETRES